MSDEEIIEMLFNRDEHAIYFLEQKYGGYCRKIASNILQHEQDVEECLNDTWLSVWNSVPPQRPKYLLAYVGTIARNHSLNCLRSRKREKRSGDENSVPIDSIYDIFDENDFADKKLFAEELGKVISEYLYTLSSQKRNVFVAYYWYFESVTEISEHMKISKSMVKAILYRARQGLREYLKKKDWID